MANPLIVSMDIEVMDRLFGERDATPTIYIHSPNIFAGLRESLKVDLAYCGFEGDQNERGKAPVHMRHERNCINKFQGASRKGKKRGR